jgi:hypothetical protein
LQLKTPAMGSAISDLNEKSRTIAPLFGVSTKTFRAIINIIIRPVRF